MQNSRIPFRICTCVFSIFIRSYLNHGQVMQGTMHKQVLCNINTEPVSLDLKKGNLRHNYIRIIQFYMEKQIQTKGLNEMKWNLKAINHPVDVA